MTCEQLLIRQTWSKSTVLSLSLWFTINKIIKWPRKIGCCSLVSRNFLSAGSLCRTDEMIRLPRRLVKNLSLHPLSRSRRLWPRSWQIERTRSCAYVSRAARAIAARRVFRAHRWTAHGPGTGHTDLLIKVTASVSTPWPVDTLYRSRAADNPPAFVLHTLRPGFSIDRLCFIVCPCLSAALLWILRRIGLEWFS